MLSWADQLVPQFLMEQFDIMPACLQNQKAYDFETWHEAAGNGALQSLYKSLPWDDLDPFYSKVNLSHISQISGERL